MSQFKIPNEPSGMEIAQREADEAAGDADPRERVWGASPPDWLTPRLAHRAGQSDRHGAAEEATVGVPAAVAAVTVFESDRQPPGRDA